MYSYRKSRTLHDEISLWLTYSTYHNLATKKNNVYQPHSKNIHRLYNKAFTHHVWRRCWKYLSAVCSHASHPANMFTACWGWQEKYRHCILKASLSADCFQCKAYHKLYPSVCSTGNTAHNSLFMYPVDKCWYTLIMIQRVYCTAMVVKMELCVM